MSPEVIVEKHIVTEDDIKNNPDKGWKIGDEVELPEGVYDEATAKAKDDFEKETRESFERIKPIVRGIIKLVDDQVLPIGNNTEAEDNEYFKVAERVLALMRDQGMKYMEKDTVFQVLLQPFDKIRTIVLAALNKSANHAVDLRMGKQFGDVTLVDLDAILKAEVPVEKKPEEVV